MATVRTGARLHLGFQNLSLAHERLYGGVGLALAAPGIEVHAERADTVECDDPVVSDYVVDAVSVLDVPGAAVSVRDRYDRHVGLGSGTQLALSSLKAIARAYDRSIDVRELAPTLGRGGRSGVGVATFERGGFVVDAGHPTARFTTAPPDRGDWSVPKPIVSFSVPADWRFVLVTPAADPGPSGPPEDERMRSVVERADPGIADDVAALLTRRLLPALVEGDREAFGGAAARLGRLNGAWYADEQGGVYRPPAGRIIEALDSVSAISGTGQSSWGPTVYGVTDAASVERAVGETHDVLADHGIDTRIRCVEPRNAGAATEECTREQV